MKSAVVIPTYNEADNIEGLVRAIHEACPEIDVIVVDDASPDGTAAIAHGLDGVHVIERAGKLGLGTAYVAGFNYTMGEGYEAICSMDADFSHDPKVLPALLALMDDYDVGIGARYMPGGGTRNWGVHRQILSRSANLVAKAMLHMPATDVTSGYRCYRRHVLERVALDTLHSEGYSFLVELLFRCVKQGFRIGQTPIVFEERRGGVSKLDKSEIWRGMVNLVRLRFGG